MKKGLIIVFILFLLIPSSSFAAVLSLQPVAGANYPVDGVARQQTNPVPPLFAGNAWIPMRTAAGNTSSDVSLDLLIGFNEFNGGTGTFKAQSWLRSAALFAWDTSMIPASSTINSATLDLYESGSTLNCTLFQNVADENLRVSDAPIANNNAVVAADYASMLGQTNVYTNDLDANSFSAGAYNTLTFTPAGIAYLQGLVGAASSTAQLGLYAVADVADLPPGEENCSLRWRFMAADNGTSTAPTLNIDWSPYVAPGTVSQYAYFTIDAFHRRDIVIAVMIFLSLFILWISRIKTS